MSSVQLQRPVEETTHQHEQPLEEKLPQPPSPAQALGSTQPTTKTLGHDQVVLSKSASPCGGGQAIFGHQTRKHESHKVSSHGLAEVHSVGQQAHSKSDKKKESKSEDKKKNQEKKSEHTKKNKKKNGKKSSKDHTSNSSSSSDSG